MKTEQPSPVVLSIATIADGKFYAAGAEVPFTKATLPEHLRPYIAEPSEVAAEPEERFGNFAPNVVYQAHPDGGRGRALRREVAELSYEASWQSACEEEAARPLDSETEAALQAEHDLRIGAALTTAELRSRDADAAVTAQEEAAEQKPAAIYVKRGGAWMQAERARVRPGEPLFVKRPTGAWEAVGAVDASGGLPRRR